ncbi:MAG TPA: hypothetical protein VGB45_02405 [Abditibacterium sp.]|jgi:hypothetical protein
MSDYNDLTQVQTPVTDEKNDPKSGENDSPKAITGAVEGGWNGSVAGTNDALEPDGQAPTTSESGL